RSRGSFLRRIVAGGRLAAAQGSANTEKCRHPARDAGVTPSSSRRAILPLAWSRSPTIASAALRSGRQGDGGAPETGTSPPFRHPSSGFSGARDDTPHELPCAALI